jgi:hypothetical protein
MNALKRLPGTGKEGGKESSKPLDKAQREPGKVQRKRTATNHRQVAQCAAPVAKP